MRTRVQYYEARRAGDSSSAPASDSQGSHTRGDHGGWDAADAGNRPPLDALRVTPERIKHILDGDANDSGGHRHGVGNPGKTEFPASWNDKKIMDNILDVCAPA
jgi:hypothetical protein